MKEWRGLIEDVSPGDMDSLILGANVFRKANVRSGATFILSGCLLKNDAAS